MKVLWCWRCGRDMPMLDGPEEHEFHELVRRGLEEMGKSGRWSDQVLLDFYAAKTGFRETNINALHHHLASLYGPPCGACGKPLRTPGAEHCAACGAHASSSS